MNIAFKVVLKKEWYSFIKSGNKIAADGFGNDITAGYIHLSTHEQLWCGSSKFANVNKRNYSLLTIDLNQCDDVRWNLKLNKVLGMHELYPCLYSPLILDKNIIWWGNFVKHEFIKYDFYN